MKFEVTDGNVPRFNFLYIFIPYYISWINGFITLFLFKNEKIFSYKIFQMALDFSGKFLPFVRNPEFNWSYGYENLLVVYIATNGILFPLSVVIMLSLKYKLTSKEFWRIKSASMPKIITLVLGSFLFGVASTYLLYSGDMFQIHKISVGKAWLLQRIMLSGKFGMIAIVSFYFWLGVTFVFFVPFYTAKLIKTVNNYGEKMTT